MPLMRAEGPAKGVENSTRLSGRFVATSSGDDMFSVDEEFEAFGAQKGFIFFLAGLGAGWERMSA